MNSRLLRLSVAAAAFATFGAAWAQIPANAPYNTDPQNLYVQDQTSDGISSLNMVLCVIGGLNPGAMVNTGPYLALVDMTKCQNHGGSGTAASTGATSYANAVVDATRPDTSSPMVAKVWMSFTEQGQVRNVYAHLSATHSPDEVPPYGVFRLDYVGKQGSVIGFNGYIDASAGMINFLETGPNSGNTAMAMTANSTTSGSGTMRQGGGSSGMPLSTFDFAYDPSYFRRYDGTHDECFDRAKAHAAVAVWQYGTYNANDGSRVDLPHPGIPLKADDGTSTYFGFGNYWGINFQGLDIPDGQPVAGVTVSDQRPNNSSTYALNKAGGKLTRWTQASATLGALDGIPFTVGTDLASLVTGTPPVTGWGNWVVQWSTRTLSFSVIGQQNCGSNGCLTSSFNPPLAVNGDALASLPLSGWADSYGGNLDIPPTGGAHTAADPVHYYQQSTVLPGTASLNLSCLSQCPTTASLAAFSAGSASSSPYGNGTGQQWFSAPGASSTVSYTFGSSGLMENGTPVVLEQASQFPSGSPFANNGIQTGWLFPAALDGASCPPGSPAGTVCQPSSPSVYYTWQTGPQQWNQSVWLTHNGSVVAFDPPQNIPFNVPNAAAFGSYAGAQLLLQFNGFGNLNGIPGTCVDPVGNGSEDCSVQGARYVPAFSIPDGTAMTLPASGGSAAVPLLVKALNGEIRLAQAPGQCTTMNLSAQTLPSGGLHDPSNSGDSEYLGTLPSVPSAPKVIDGVVQN